jgi:hypothetical protein
MKFQVWLFVLAAFAARCALAQGVEGSRFFPDTGKEAIHQRTLDLGHDGVVLAISLQPGYEDFPLLAYLRTGIGVRVCMVYMTNGESTLNDRAGCTAEVTAGERKEEAHAAMRMLDVNERFLNLPDPGVVGSLGSLESIWGRDTVRARLREVVLYYRPDVVIIGGDLQGDSVRSLRQRAAIHFVRDAIGTFVPKRKKGQQSTPGSPLGNIVLYVESQRSPDRSREKRYDNLHPLWEMSYRAIGAEAAEVYQTMLSQIGFCQRQGDRYYLPLSVGANPDLFKVTERLPAVGSKLRSLATMLRRLSSSAKRLHSPRLADVLLAIDSVDHRLARGRRAFSMKESRVLAGWKDDLENLRCALLRVMVSYAASDSLIAVNQLFYLKFNGLSSRSSHQGTKIFFPLALDHTWGVNESASYQFPFNPTDRFEILTPQRLKYVYPPSQFGITQSFLRTRFPFILIHSDPLPHLSYLYRGDVMLRPAPKRTFEVLTPVIRAVAGQPVICRFTNVSRDAFEGELTLEDSLLHSVHKKLSLKGKDTVLLDTLLLALRKDLPPGDYPASLSLRGAVTANLTLRSFQANVDSGAHVLLMTSSDDSPVGHALGRLGIPWNRIDLSGQTAVTISGANVVIIDRNALGDLYGNEASVQGVMSWVRSGGRLLILPQSEVAEGGEWFIHEIRFIRSPSFAPETALNCDTISSIGRYPNILSEDDWKDWVFARSFCSIKTSPERKSRVLVSDRSQGIPLVVSFQEGDGQITLVALNLSSQLIDINPGAHRVLANLLAIKP